MCDYYLSFNLPFSISMAPLFYDPSDVSIIVWHIWTGLKPKDVYGTQILCPWRHGT